MTEKIYSTQPNPSQAPPALPDRQSRPAEISAACQADLECRISALQSIVSQLLAENERLRRLALQLP